MEFPQVRVQVTRVPVPTEAQLETLLTEVTW